jgi:hypothetical protein
MATLLREEILKAKNTRLVMMKSLKEAAEGKDLSLMGNIQTVV